jgi:tRNA (guanine37-N1)-methyltransferase
VPDPLAGTPGALERDAQIEVPRDVVRIRPERGAVAVDRAVGVAVFEQQVADIDQRRRVGFDGDEGVAKRRPRLVTAAGRDQGHAPLVERQRPVAPWELARQRGREALERFVVAPALERREPAFDVGVPGAPAARRGEQPFDVEHAGVFIVDIVTLFPEMFAPAIGLSIVGRAQERGIVRIVLHDLLDALGPGERADDRPYGGGAGMVLRLEPIARILDGLLAQAPAGERRAIVLTSPAGRPFRQADAERLAALDRLVVVCGHYEGIDERLVSLYEAEELSLGDFVLTGGEIPALAFIDATVRLRAGVLTAASLESESFGGGGLDAPAYTRPPRFRGASVPDVLLSGDHERIAEWRRQRSRERTAARRPDLGEGGESDRR